MPDPVRLSGGPHRCILIVQEPDGRWRITEYGQPIPEIEQHERAPGEFDRAVRIASALHWNTGLPIGIRRLGERPRPYILRTNGHG